MKNYVFLIAIIISTTTYSAFGQQKTCDYTNNNYNFISGLFTGIMFNEVLGLNNYNSYKRLYFKYIPHKNSWRLQKDFINNTSPFYNNKVLAKFENPNGGKDFIVTINRRGQWALDCPKRLVKLFKKKVIKNL